MTKCHMRLIGVAGLNDSVAFFTRAPRWLASFDPNANNGRGAITTTTSRERALVFQDAKEALAFYQTVASNRPLRPDGKPNKPLTAYHIELVGENVEPTSL